MFAAKLVSRWMTAPWPLMLRLLRMAGKAFGPYQLFFTAKRS
jgi:hypothetical protein